MTSKSYFSAMLIAIIIAINLTPIYSNAQAITIDSTFTSSGEIFPFNPTDTIYGLGLSGDIVLNSDTSLVRVIFIDADYNEHLLYEAYPYIVSNWSFSFSNVSDETKFLNQTQPHSILVYLSDASIEINSLYCTAGPVDYADSLQVLHKQVIELQKVNNINDNIQENNLHWYAAETSISGLSYAEKKAILGENYNMHGFDYYSAGIYSVPFGDEILPVESDLIPEFDWRNRHNANEDIIPNSPYYHEFLGWMTAVGDQECKHCWIFAPVHATEAVVNLFYNQQLNLNLSEQAVASCKTPWDNCNGGYNWMTLDYIKNPGIVDEICFPYITGNAAGSENPCNLCTNPTDKISIYDYIKPNEIPGYDEIKTLIINKGPIILGIDSWWHYMAFIGFGRIKYMDEIFYINDYNISHTISDPDDPDIGKNYWLVKNSWGTGWGENGFGRIKCPTTEFYDLLYIVTPVISTESNYTVHCRDVDNDGYYNWGIGETKPAFCPTCPDQGDSNDGDPRIGPFDENYFGLPIKPDIQVSTFNNPIDNNGFNVISDISTPLNISFNVVNNGTAQLNFEEDSSIPPKAKITITGDDASAFSYTNKLESSISMDGGTDSFSITYNGSCAGQTECSCIVTIHLDEPDMDDFSFAIIYADCNHVPSLQTIDGVVTWGNLRVITDSYLITDKGKLTISGNVGFTDQVELVVQPGGQLIIDGGHLTNACSQTWKGIDVWGNAKRSQYPESNQGLIEIINGGCIENADEAVQLTRFQNGQSNSNYNGGIIKCNDAVFRNNIKDVEFYYYYNFDPQQLNSDLPNRSYFYETQFLNTKICDKSYHLGMRNVSGVWLKGCEFINSVDAEIQNCSNINRGIGIYSFNSGFILEERNTGSGTMALSRFENLHYGVKAINAEFNEFIRIDTTVFNNTTRGVFMSLVSEQVLIRNRFTYDGSYKNDSQNVPYGLYMEYCNNFKVEENLFLNESDQANILGLQVSNTGPVANEIYNNAFVNLNTGITANGTNRDQFGTGLCIRCNDFTDCNSDINVTDEGGQSGYYGIAFKQGDIAPEPPQGQDPDPTYAAGNTFTEMEGDYTNYTNLLSCYSIEYTLHGSIGNPNFKIEPDPTFPEQPTIHIDLTPDIEVTYNSKNEACPSNYGTGIDQTAEMKTLAGESSMLNAYEDTLSLFVDGGDTEALNLDVQLSFPSEALEVRQELLNNSPYLSDTVMKTAIVKENVLPNALIRDVLVANPQSAKSPEVLNTLDIRFDPMPDYMMDEIMLGQYLYGNKEVLEQKLSVHKSARDLTFAKLMRHYLSDTVNTASSSDSIVSLLYGQEYLDARYKLCVYYLSKSDSANAFSILNNIPFDFDLSLNEQEVWELYSELFNINWEIMSDTTGADSTHIAGLFAIYGHQNTMPALYARNLLINEGELVYSELVFLGSTLKVAPIWQKRPLENPASDLYVFPNPAHSYFIVEYSMESFANNSQIILTDISGKHIKAIEISCQQNQIVVPVEDLPNGAYILQLLEGSNIIQSEKIIVSK